MQEVKIDQMSLERLAGLLDPDRAELLMSRADLARELLDGRSVWNVNATATGRRPPLRGCTPAGS
jgi:trehalose synthase